VLIGVFGHEGVLYATIVMSLLVIIFAEVLPKTIAINSPDQVSLWIARPVDWTVTLFGPVTLTIERLVRLMLRPFGVQIGRHEAILSATEEIRGQLALLHREGGVVKDERDMLGGLLDLTELLVSDVMVHRTKMRSIDADLPSEDIVREVLASPYTRLPLWRETPDNIIGVVHAKDLLRALEARKSSELAFDIESVAVKPWFVPDTTSLRGQLKAFLARKQHFALVVDEYGDLMGLVTLEDILEEIVGEISDEHDVAVQGVRQQADGSVHVDGSVPVRDLNRVMDWTLPDEEATTIAGLVIHEAQAIPDAGQVFNFHGFRFEVLRKARNRITALKVSPTVRPTAGE
jgi:Mg2+/Co2+ transporter CorB